MRECFCFKEEKLVNTLKTISSLCLLSCLRKNTQSHIQIYKCTYSFMYVCRILCTGSPKGILLMLLHRPDLSVFRHMYRLEILYLGNLRPQNSFTTLHTHTHKGILLVKTIAGQFASGVLHRSFDYYKGRHIVFENSF